MSNVTMKQGKTATRGEKTILQENKESLAFYRNIIGVVMAISLIPQLTIDYTNLNNTFCVMNGVAAILYFSSWKFMSFMAQVRRGMNGEVLDCGTDLNMENGMAEHCKDLIILTAGVQIAAMWSEYCWFLLLSAPARGLYMFWVHVAAPWIFAPAPEQEEVSEKNKRRQERKQMKFKRS